MARQTKPGDGTRETAAFYLERSQLEVIRRTATSQKISQSEVVRQIIDAAIRREERRSQEHWYDADKAVAE